MVVKMTISCVRLSPIENWIEVDEFEFNKYFQQFKKYSWESLVEIHPRLSEYILKNNTTARMTIDQITDVEFQEYFGTKFEMQKGI